MIINRKDKIGYLDKDDLFNPFGLIEYDFQAQTKKEFSQFKDWKFSDISADKRYFALISDWITFRGTNKTEIVILDTVTEDIIFSTKDYMTYTVKFSADGTKLLFDVKGLKPFCIDLLSKTIVAKIPKSVRIFNGDFDLETDNFYAPVEKKKNTFCVFNFQDGNTQEYALKISACIHRVRFSNDRQKVYFLADDNALYCTDRDYKIIWKTDFNAVKAKTVWSSAVYCSENGDMLCLEAAETASCKWGADFVVDASNGKILKQFDAYKGRGKLKSDYFGNKFVTFKGTTLDIETGEVSENIII